jgi:hypothetical protein
MSSDGAKVGFESIFGLLLQYHHVPLLLKLLLGCRIAHIVL